MTKIDIFSGFLGAGKTTLIKKLIKEAYAGEKLVLIENEFGEIGIDGSFMQDAGIEITEMNSGCICCSLVGDFGKALEKVLTEFKPDRILIEPSGVGKLSDVIKAVERIHSHDAVLNSFTTLVDAKKAKIYMKNFGEFFNDQVESANSLVLSRTGDISAEKLNDVLALLREHNPNATIITTPWEELSGKDILFAMEKRSTLEKALQELNEEAHHHHEDEDDDGDECCCHDHHEDEDDDGDEDEHHHHHHDDDDDDDECCCHSHHEDEEDGHEHHHHHHHGHDADEVFISWGVETARKYSEKEIGDILTKLSDEKTYGLVLRAKGVVDGAEGKWIHFDYVPEEQDVRTGPAAVTGRLCVIGSKLQEEALKALFNVR